MNSIDEILSRPVEQERQDSYRKGIGSEHFWQGLATGTYQPLSETEKSRLEQEYFRYTPLTPLTEAEEGEVREMVRYQINNIDSDQKRHLVEHKIAYINPETSYNQPFDKAHRLIDLDLLREGVDDSLIDFLHKSNVSALTQEQKMKLLSDINLFHTLVFREGNTESSLLNYGNRNFSEYRIIASEASKKNIKPELFYQLLTDHIRQRVLRDKLKVMDIGGGSGKALFDIKQLDQNTETFNISMDEEPVMYPMDHFCLAPAERLPAEFQESIDLILSNMAFKYVRLPGVGLFNVIKCLSVGGEALIDHIGVAEMYRRHQYEEARAVLFLAIDKIRELERRNVLEVQFLGLEDESAIQNNFIQMRLVKKQSTSSIQF